MRKTTTILVTFVMIFIGSCSENKKEMKTPNNQNATNLSAKEILGNPKYLAISYGGYRQTSRDIQPTIEELKDDMRILNAMGVRILRTYNVQLPQAGNILKAISELKAEDKNFEMYVMLGAWIDCLNAWTGKVVNHNVESPNNASEIERTVALANQYPDIVKIIAVGNEAMVKWAESYYVQPDVILKWVNHLQTLKAESKLPQNLWVTTSDNFASWGGGDAEYHVEALNKLIKAVDYISMHTYPMHDTHYNPVFWGVKEGLASQSKEHQINAAMKSSLAYAKSQYNGVKNYMDSLGVDKPIHIGETGWASGSNGLYGNGGSKATDEYKEGVYYKLMREWTNTENISCFYFEAFDEPWKDAQNPEGSENHFGLFTLNGEAKYAVWDLVDTNNFEGLKRNNNAITKTYSGSKERLLEKVLIPELKKELITH